MSWPSDSQKLDGVRAMMREADLDALVVRAPDNIVYLANYQSMKGYDVVVFPQEGDPALIVIEPQLEDAQAQSWAPDIRPFDGYDPTDPRPPTARALLATRSALADRGIDGRVGLELSQGTQAADLMVGEPTTPTAELFAAFPHAIDASPLLARARMIKTPQEIERMRLANDVAAAAMAHVRRELRPGVTEVEAAALWEGHVHAHAHQRDRRIRHARGYSLVWSGPGIRTFTATGTRPVQEHEPTLFEIWVCVDGYWCDHTKNACPGELTAAYDELLDALLGIFDRAVARAVPGASLAELDRTIRDELAEAGFPGQPSHPVCHGVGARAHEPPYAHQAGEGSVEAGMVLAIEPGAYLDGGGGLRLEDNFLITPEGNEKLCSDPDDFRVATA